MRRLLFLLPAAVLLVGCNETVAHKPLSTIQPRGNAIVRNAELDRAGDAVERSASRFWGITSHGMMAAVDVGQNFESYLKFEVAERVTYDLGLDINSIVEGHQMRDKNYALPNKSRTAVVDPVPNNITDRTPVRHDGIEVVPTLPTDPVDRGIVSGETPVPAPVPVPGRGLDTWA